MISASHSENADLSSATTTLSSDSTTSVTVINYKGSNLPSTGGNGTYAVYAAGIILILTAALALVIRRRKASKEQ